MLNDVWRCSISHLRWSQRAELLQEHRLQLIIGIFDRVFHVNFDVNICVGHSHWSYDRAERTGLRLPGLL